MAHINILVSNEILPLGMVMLSLQFRRIHVFLATLSVMQVRHLQTQLINIQLRNRLRVHMVGECAWVSIPGERDLPKSLIGALAWSSDHTYRYIRTHARK